MIYSTQLQSATLIKRYKRFLADVELPDGRIITIHSPNTGSMMGCAEPGMQVWIRDTNNPKRKYQFAWELSETANGVLVGINTILANKLVKEAIKSGVIDELQGFNTIRPEVKYGDQNSRIDLLLENETRRCYVEIKNVTAKRDEEVAMFPDAVTQRGTKHLQELMSMVEQGHRAVILFNISRGDVRSFSPADEIDRVYGQTLRQAITHGVEALAYVSNISTKEIKLSHSVPVICS
ncbi:MAG: DNA/RNA nuclease SfsA [Gammaproteobacteria bacterium]|nr:DNA/RNA nuclease SfsA [Gammaproteobacteria bacterium]